MYLFIIIIIIIIVIIIARLFIIVFSHDYLNFSELETTECHCIILWTECISLALPEPIRLF